MVFTDILHVYGADCSHGEVCIVGTDEALVQLRNAIQRAIAAGHGSATVMANDGEGYSVLVAKVDAETMDKMARHYKDEELTGGQLPDAIYPHKLPQIRAACDSASKG